MYTCDLKHGWQLRSEELYCDRDSYATVINKEDGWIEVETLPCDVHVPLIERGLIDDPVVADNCFKCEWIEDKSWWFRKVFGAGPELLDSRNSELVIEGLDAEADLFLNGSHIGRHDSAMYPFHKDVRDLLLEGENLLVIRVTSGLEHYSELDLSTIKDYISSEYKKGRGPRGDNRRVLVRKPSYVYGWDWNPRIATCGIMGDTRIEAYKDIAIRNVRFATNALAEGRAKVSVEAEIENLYPITTIDANVVVDISFNSVSVQSQERDVFMTSGINYVTFSFTIDDPALWWPNGMGEQNLYIVKVRARTPSGAADSHEFKTGIRTLKLNTDRIDQSSRMFAFVINGFTVFCKGGNWVTPDSIYGRIDDEKYEALIREARDANFNMIRVNGVNTYERDYFYECCDRDGILIWQDFAFSCAAYPDELGWFRQEVEKEVDYQTKRLRNHPCIVLWCGNNECQGLMATYQPSSYWDGAKKPASPGGTLLYNDMMPRIIRNNTPDIPYWNSSPYGGEDLQSDEYGDRHPWAMFFMNADIDKRVTPEEYDKIGSKFVSEFGFMGPTRKSSVYKYFGSENLDMRDDIWKLHTNTFEKETVRAGIMKHYADPESLSIDEYLLYGGLFQGVMLGYAFESIRCAKDTNGALIWSYNDCWGEIGWSIVDYYVRRKIAYYFVKRALAHRKLIMREAGGEICVFCANDTMETLEFDLEYGYTTFDGAKRNTASKTVTVDPCTKASVVARILKSQNDATDGLFYAKTDSICGITPTLLRSSSFRELVTPRPTVKIAKVNECGDRTIITVISDYYAHGVHLGLDEDVLLSDEYFDLLPGESRDITVMTDNARAALESICPSCVYT